MAHYRWTLTLILISLPILATVISAFRVRDFPKATHETSKTDFKKKRCDNCDDSELKVSQILHTAKIESGRRYDDLKKATQEKLQKINKKTSEAQSNLRFKRKGDENDDDNNDSIDFVISDSVLNNNIHSKANKDIQPTAKLKSMKSVNKEKAYNDDSDDDEDEDNDDDDDDEDDITINTGSKAPLLLKNVEKKKIETKILASEIDEDSDEDDDDSTDSDEIYDAKKKPVVLPKDIKPPSIKSTAKLVVTSAKNGDDDIDNNKDDITNFLSKKVSSKPKEINDHQGNMKQRVVENDDDDDDNGKDDSDDDDNDDDDQKRKPKQKSQTKIESYIKIVKSSPTIDDKLMFKSWNKDENTEKQKERKLELKDQEYENEKQSNKNFEQKTKDNKQHQEEKKISKPTKVVNPTVTTKKVDEKEIKDENITEDKRKEPVKKEEAKRKPIQRREIKSKDEDKKIDKKSATETKKTEEKLTKHKTDIIPDTEHKKEKEHSKKDKSSKETLFDSREMFPKSESNLKHVTDALQRRNLLQSEFEDFYAFFPTFAPNFSRIHNPECRRHGQIVLRQLRGTKLWAFNMLDATAKIPSGLLQGNGLQLGDYDQCLSSRARVQLESGNVVKVQGQYCLASLDVKAEHPDLELPVHLAQAKNLIKSRIDDPGHFVPRFSTLRWGVCVPTACAPEDVEVVLKDALKHYQHTSGLVVRIKVDPTDCHTLDADWWERWLELPTILTLSLYAFVVLLVFVATVQDFISRKKSTKTKEDETDDQEIRPQKETEDEQEVDEVSEKKDGVLNAFSLYHSIGKLVAPSTDDEVASIHGIRGLATLALLVAHKFISVGVTPFSNRLKITETVSSPLWSWCRAGWVFTDCFLLLSGALTAHRSGGNTSAPWRLFQRYIRLTPALLALVLFYAYVWDDVSQGPMWGTLVTKNAGVCQAGWWWNLLYVQNYFGFEDMCAPQTHQLALDMQLTIIGIAIVWAIQSKIPFAKYVIPSILVYATYSRYSNVQEHRLTMVAYHGVSVSQLYRTARLSYTSTLHRSTPYLIGLSLGLLLRKPHQHGKITLTFGWLICLTLWSLVWWAGFDTGSTQYRYSASFAAQYASLAPIASAAAIAWVIYTVHGGQCEWLARFLSCRFLALLSRLSYALYLTQFIVFLTKAAIVRTSTEFTLISMIDAQEISAILILSIILTLTFVIPMQSVHKLFSFSSTSVKELDKEKKVVEETEVQEHKEELIENSEDNIGEVTNIPLIRNRQHFVAHREVLEEIPELEIEYEMQRERNEGLEEILEEEEDEEPEEREDDDDLEIIEEEQGGEDDLWEERDTSLVRRPYSRNDNDQDLDEWEWTTNGNNRNGAQYYRYSR
ncbi:unnamed protein product [Diatraea saccharalis]|uniref:Nose resistant-to-fluoxetine protein N-terminal domain-containing protein n=1 Tax=Diatraea saccharalis TaxID=40085 RepID=A0A9N9R8S4_9NEOP|nr:unnamed protein product [Diatraea saccharalis]